MERRLIDAISRMFNDSKSFYFSHTGDLTRSLQQQVETEEGDDGPSVLPLWKKVINMIYFMHCVLVTVCGIVYVMCCVIL